MSSRFHRVFPFLSKGAWSFAFPAAAVAAATLGACSSADPSAAESDESFLSHDGDDPASLLPGPVTPIPGVPAPGDPAAPASLKTVKIPEPANLGDFVRNRQAAIVLGKALFWDMQIGSDGVQACASCHFHAGADSRSKNQLNPGTTRATASAAAKVDTTFQVGDGVNYQLRKSDFPFHKKSNPKDRDSSPTFDANDVTSSQGVTNSELIAVEAGKASDARRSVKDPDGFRVGAVNTRRVEARNTPSVINAVFNFRNFWDARAQNEFNGVNELGAKDPNAFVFKAAPNGALSREKVLLKNSSLASQATEPPVSSREMSAAGRTLRDLGEKLGDGDRKPVRTCHRGGHSSKVLPLRPLGQQVVHCDDSVLGKVSRAPRRGLEADAYSDLVEAAFRPEWWKSDKVVEVDAHGVATVRDRATSAAGTHAYTLMEYNFSLFFGLAIQMYEATLVSDDTPFDRYRDGDANALTPQQKLGLDLFLSQTRGRCINCHGGPELTDASITRYSVNTLRRRNGNILDFGFNNIGVRPTSEDLGIGGTHPLNPSVILSNARLAFLGQYTDPSLNPPISAADTLGVDGAFKVPGLRNVELTAPYFHNGGERTLHDVIDFYGRGGNFHPIVDQTGKQISPLEILNTTDQEKEAFVAFLIGLTDERVRYAKAPFDHPQLYVPNGHPGDSKHVKDGGGGVATDDVLEIPAVGRNGGAPLRGFLEK